MTHASVSQAICLVCEHLRLVIKKRNHCNQAEDRSVYQLFLADLAELLATIEEHPDAATIKTAVDRHSQLLSQTWTHDENSFRAISLSWQSVVPILIA